MLHENNQKVKCRETGKDILTNLSKGGENESDLKISSNREVSQLSPIQIIRRAQNKDPLGSESTSGVYAHKIDETVT